MEGDDGYGVVEFTGSPDSINESISLGLEESFTLETYQSLIDGAKKNGKKLLLARVITVDPFNSGSLYYFYYEANHINKVLFRKETNCSILHRMKSKNPLNNMPIVGDVQYYIIDPTIEYSEEDTLLNNPKVMKKYKADYFANDDSFLEDENVRRIFVLNSIDPKDHQIFELGKRKIQQANNESNYNDDDDSTSALINLIISRRNQRSNALGLRMGFITPVGFILFSTIVLAAISIYSYNFYSEEIASIAIGTYVVFFVILLLILVGWRRVDDQDTETETEQDIVFV